MQILWQDLRYGARMLLKKPGFTLISIITLALAIGANTAIFSVVDAVLLQPLPYPDSDRLMRIWEVYRQEKSTASFPCLTDMRKQSRSFAQIAAYEYERLILTGSDRPEYVTGMKVSADFFQTLSLKPALGRDFQAEDDRYGASHVVIIGHGLWQRRFSGNQRAIGREMTINNETYVVVGVLPPGVEYPDPHVEIWAPLALEPKRSVDRGNHFLNVIGRLNTDVSTQVAQSDMNAVARRMEEEYPNNNKGVGVLIMPLNEELVGEVRRALLVLLGAVGFVLLIACANVATLLLARAAGRQKELAIRAALGANRRMMIRQLMMESLLLSLFGGGMGLLLALWLVDLLAPAIPGGIHNAKAVGLNSSVLGFTIAISLLTGIFFGLAPALRGSKTDLNEALRDGGRGMTGGLRHQRLRNAFVAVEMALALALLAGGGLLIKSFWRLQLIEPGFDPRHALTFTLNLPETRYAGAQRQNAFIAQVLERLAALPGITAVGATSELPFTGSRTGSSFEIEGRPPLPPGQSLNADTRAVSADYFRALGIPLRRGRVFTLHDDAESPGVAIINERAARSFFPNEESIGKRVIIGGKEKYEIIGIVGDLKHENLRETTRPEIYRHAPQVELRTWMDVAVRTVGAPEKMAAAVREAVRSVDPDQPVYNLLPMEERLARSIARNRFFALLLGLFAAVAMILSAGGIYGVMSYTVTQRTHEIGLRMALGAQRSNVLSLVIREGMSVALIGIGAGVIAALALTRLMRGLLYEVGAGDPLTFAVVTALLSAVALLACYLPARRAARVDPMVSLRCD